MSLSQPRVSTNPVSKFYRWNGGDGTLSYYNKESKENIKVELPLNFVVLDQLTTISGFSDKYQGGFSSNEVRSTKDNLKVVCYGKNNKGEKQIYNIAEGSYESIKDKLKAEGAKYCKSVYAVTLDAKDNLELVNFQLSGSALAPFFTANVNDDGSVIAMAVNPEVQKKGKTEYYEPIFTKLSKPSDAVLQKAVAIDEELQEYLKSYFTRNNEVQEVVEDTGNNTLPDIDVDDLEIAMPF